MEHIKTLVIWKDIPGFEGLYQANQFGQIKSLPKLGRKEKILKPDTTNKGYFKVNLYKNGEVYRKFVHRLVAETFLPNEFNLPQIDHINNDKKDNRLCNLQWIKGVDNLRRKVQGVCIPQFVVCVETEQIFPSFSEAARTVGLKSTSGISRVCKGEQKTAGGFHWRYATDVEANTLYPDYVQFLNEVM